MQNTEKTVFRKNKASAAPASALPVARISQPLSAAQQAPVHAKAALPALTKVQSGFWLRMLTAVLPVALLIGALAFALGRLQLVSAADSAGGEKTYYTLSHKPASLQQLAGIAAAPGDTIYFSSYQRGQGALYVQRALQCTVQVDGAEKPVSLSAGTVEDALAAAGVTLGEHDYTEPSLHSPVAPGSAVVVHRVRYESRVSQVQVKPAVRYESTPLLIIGQTETATKGVAGVNDVTHSARYVDGKLESEKIIKVEVVKKPVDTVILKGTRVTVSRVPGPQVKDNVPVSYARMFTARCSAYSSSGGRGASGLGLYPGTVAVNPNVIPYGTKMYITSADGKFVYGYAIATDTGTALMQGVVDLDLFFGTYEESLRFGVKNLNVYIIG